MNLMKQIIIASALSVCFFRAGASVSASPTKKPPAKPAPPVPQAEVTAPDLTLFRLAQGLFQDGLYENAASQFRRYLQEFPQGPNREEAVLMLGRSLYLLKDYSAAVAVFTAELSRAKTFLDQMLFYTGECAYLLHQDERSVQAFRQLLSDYPNYPAADQARRRLAQIAYRQGNRNLALGAYSRALGYYEQAGSSVPELEPRIAYKMGECFFHLGRLEEADRALKKAVAGLVSSDPDTAGMVMFRRAQMFEAADQPEAALAAYQEFLQAAPGHALAAAAHQAVARLYAGRSDYRSAVIYLREHGPARRLEEAVQEFEAAWEHLWLEEYAEAEKILQGLTRFQWDPKLRAKSSRLLARAYAEEDKTAEAARVLSEWMESDPGRVDDACRLELAGLYFQSSQLAAAEAVLQSISAQATPAVAEQARFLRGELKLRRGELAAAEKEYQNYLAQYSAGVSVAEVRLRLGEIRAMQGDHAGAIKLLRQATPSAADPKILLRGYGLLAESYRKQGMVDSALAASEAQKQLLPLVASAEEQALAGEAELYYRKGEYAKGIALYDELAGRGLAPRHQEYRWRQGFGLYRIGRREEAKALWQALAAESEGPAADRARFWLARLQAESGDPAGANAALQAIITDEPDLAAMLSWHMARNLEAQGALAEARQKYEELARDFPDSLLETRGRLLALALQAEDYPAYMQQMESALDLPRVNFSEAELLARVRAAALAKEEAELARLARLLKVVAVEEAAVEEADFLQARLKIERGQRSQGLKELQHLWGENPATPFAGEIAFYLGEDLFLQSRYEPALARLKTLDLNQASAERSARVLFMIGVCEGKLGHTREMVESFSRLVNSYPDDSYFLAERMQVGVALKLAGEYDLAVAAFEQALKHEEDRAVLAETQYWLGECYQKKGDDLRAITEFLKVSYLYPEQGIWATSAKYQAATILEKLGRYQEAVRLYEMVVKESQNSEQEAFAKQKLEAAKKKLSPPPH